MGGPLDSSSWTSLINGSGIARNQRYSCRLAFGKNLYIPDMQGRRGQFGGRSAHLTMAPVISGTVLTISGYTCGSAHEFGAIVRELLAFKLSSWDIIQCVPCPVVGFFYLQKD